MRHKKAIWKAQESQSSRMQTCVGQAQKVRVAAVALAENEVFSKKLEAARETRILASRAEVLARWQVLH